MLPNRLTMITLGVADVSKSRDFYERLGFVASGFESESVAFFQMSGTILGLYGRSDLAEDAGVADEPGPFKSTALAINFEAKGDVDKALEFAASCGADIIQPAREVFWGGYSGYFSDPDGHLWELAYNPLAPLDDNGNMTLPPPSGRQ